MSKYIKKLIFPVIWLFSMTFIIALNVIPADCADYFFCLYFGGFFFYFTLITKDFSLKELKQNIVKSMFWKNVAWAILVIILFYGIGYLIVYFLPSKWNIEFITFKVHRNYNLPSSIAFFFSAILFPAMGQELFYRKAIISFKTKQSRIISLLVSSLLFAINDNLDLFGIISSFMGGIGFALPYIKTKNIYVVIIAHYIVSIALTTIAIFLK